MLTLENKDLVKQKDLHKAVLNGDPCLFLLRFHHMLIGHKIACFLSFEEQIVQFSVYDNLVDQNNRNAIK